LPIKAQIILEKSALYHLDAMAFEDPTSWRMKLEAVEFARQEGRGVTVAGERAIEKKSCQVTA
jgi:hypothetical protein